MALLGEYPQGYWEGNQFVLPTIAPLQQTVPPIPVAAAAPPVSPLLRVKPLLAQPDWSDDWTDPPDPNSYISLASPSPQDEAALSFGTPENATYPYGSGQRTGRVLGAGVGLLAGIPIGGLLGSWGGAYSDVIGAEKEMEALGYARPDLSTWDAWDPFGAQAYGWTPDTSVHSQLMGHFMGISDPDDPDYTPLGEHEIWSEALDVPGMGSSEEAIRAAIAQVQGEAEMAAAEAQEAEEAAGLGWDFGYGTDSWSM